MSLREKWRFLTAKAEREDELEREVELGMKP